VLDQLPQKAQMLVRRRAWLSMNWKRFVRTCRQGVLREGWRVLAPGLVLCPPFDEEGTASPASAIRSGLLAAVDVGVDLATGRRAPAFSRRERGRVQRGFA